MINWAFRLSTQLTTTRKGCMLHNLHFGLNERIIRARSSQRQGGWIGCGAERRGGEYLRNRTIHHTYTITPLHPTFPRPWLPLFLFVPPSNDLTLGGVGGSRSALVSMESVMNGDGTGILRGNGEGESEAGASRYRSWSEGLEWKRGFLMCVVAVRWVMVYAL